MAWVRLVKIIERFEFLDKTIPLLEMSKFGYNETLWSTIDQYALSKI